MRELFVKPDCYDSSLPRAEWERERSAHRDRVRPWVEDRTGRAANGIKHPVYDFLFEYYAFRPAHLLRWSPGVGVRLEDSTRNDADWREWTRDCEGGTVIAMDAFPSRRHEFLKWGIAYLDAIASREPVYGCFGLHEWAMVYRDSETRHRVPLRLSQSDTDSVVETGPLRCTHFDAYRFFTPSAVPLNRFPLTRETTTQHDQPGCLHVNMDLYKFAFKLAPLTSTAILSDAFELAVAARVLDMRASPYDLSEFGFPPIRIETREGREDYVTIQREIVYRGRPIRERLLGEYRRIASRLAGSSP